MLILAIIIIHHVILYDLSIVIPQLHCCGILSGLSNYNRSFHNPPTEDCTAAVYYRGNNTKEPAGIVSIAADCIQLSMAKVYLFGGNVSVYAMVVSAL